jgi:hypothetical protein
MSITKTATAHFTSGEIKFSVLRDTFTGRTSGYVNASELFRNTDNDRSIPVVPDATENANIAGNDYSVQSHGSNLSLLGFRNSIKEYNFTQTGTDVKLDIDAQAWNNNLSKNINKKFIVNGTIGSDDTSVPAASVDAEIRNLTIDISGTGKIRGAGGAGGVYGTNSGKGGDGGTALYARSTATSTDPNSTTKFIKIILTPTSELFAGGGGGGAGPKGGSGGTGASVHNLAGGVGGPGGNGGNGGNGQGYNSGVGNGVAGTNPGENGSSANSKQYEVSDYDKNDVPPTESVSARTYYSGTGGKGGVGGYGGNGGTFGSSGNAGNNAGQTQGNKGGDTSSANYYQFPTNENFNTYGMLVGYTKLNYKNFITKHNDICTAFAEAAQPATDSNGTTIGYKYLEFWDGSGDDWNCIMNIEDATPHLAAGETAASNPRFNINGYGLFADSGGKIRIRVRWDDSSGDAGISVNNIVITGRNSESTFTYSDGGDFYQMIDYDPFTSAEWGSSPNVGVFGQYRDATHTGNYITFGGKLVSPPTSFTPQQIDDSNGMDTFGDVTDSHNSGSHYVDIKHINMPSGTLHAPIWARANFEGWHKGVKIKSNIAAFNGIVGVALNDSGDDDDFDDLVVFPTDQRAYNESTGQGLKLNNGAILIDNAPAVPNDQGVGGGAGRAVIGLNYNVNISQANSDNVKGDYL